ncbi:MAG: DPP IV N-terminal domain-containing protein, partial [Bacteroidota bacterium]
MMRLLRTSLALALLFLPALGQTGTKSFTVQELYAPGKFSSRGFGGARWLKDGKRFVTTDLDTATRTTNLMIVDAASGGRSLFLDGSKLTTGSDAQPIRLGAYALSSDESKVLVAGPAPEKQYLSRLQPAGDLYVYDILAKTFSRLTSAGVEQWNQKFSPDGSAVAFVRGNDIYLVDLASGREQRITTDGTENVINGKFDWVYEEEFGISDGFQFSPDGMRVAFWRLDQTRVPSFRMVDHASLRSDDVVMKYPKAGDPNAIVQVGIIDLASGNRVWVDLGANDDIYVPRMTWQPDSKQLLVARLNRKQNKLEFLGADPTTGASIVLSTEETKAWIEESDSLIPAGKGRWIT